MAAQKKKIIQQKYKKAAFHATEPIQSWKFDEEESQLILRCNTPKGTNIMDVPISKIASATLGSGAFKTYLNAQNTSAGSFKQWEAKMIEERFGAKDEKNYMQVVVNIDWELNGGGRKGQFTSKSMVWNFKKPPALKLFVGKIAEQCQKGVPLGYRVCVLYFYFMHCFVFVFFSVRSAILRRTSTHIVYTLCTHCVHIMLTLCGCMTQNKKICDP